MKPRVLMVISQFWPIIGGVEIQCQRLAAELRRRQHEVTVVTGRHDRSTPREETMNGFLVMRTPILQVPRLRNVSLLLSLGWTLWRLRRRYDVIQAHQALRTAAVATLMGKLLGKPVIIKVSSGGTGSEITRMRKRRSSDWFSLLDPLLWRAIRWCDRIIAVSSEIKDELLMAGFPPEKVMEVPNGVPVEATTGGRVNKTVASDTVRAVCASGLRPIKGIDVLLEAAHRVEGVRFEILGDGPDMDHLLNMQADLGLDGSVVFHGRRDDVADFLASADIAVFPSRAEGMSNSLLEAMAQGVPCVATSVGGNRDTIEDGFNGLLVPPEDPSALAKAIQKLAANAELRARLGAEARRTICQRYDIVNVAERYAELYAVLASHPSDANMETSQR